MDLRSVTEIATIVGSFSIFFTLVFIVIELKKNLDQTKSINVANRDLVNSEFVHFWADGTNAKLVIKGRREFESLNEVELFQFESFIEQRVKLFSFGSTTVHKENRIILDYKIREFFEYPGSIQCYKNLVSKNLIPPVWRTVIDPALEENK